MQLSKGLIVCCGLVLLALPSTSLTNGSTRQKTMIIRVVLHPTQDAVTKACSYTVKGKIVRVNGCHKNKKPIQEIHAIQPSSWCDINRLDTLGHELLHAMTLRHGPNFSPPYLQPEAATGCRNGGWWTPLTNPRP